jgi:hypothetical protein
MEFYEDNLMIYLPSNYTSAYFPFLLCYLHSQPVKFHYSRKRLIVVYNHE